MATIATGSMALSSARDPRILRASVDEVRRSLPASDFVAQPGETDAALRSRAERVFQGRSGGVITNALDVGDQLTIRRVHDQVVGTEHDALQLAQQRDPALTSLAIKAGPDRFLAASAHRGYVVSPEASNASPWGAQIFTPAVDSITAAGHAQVAEPFTKGPSGFTGDGYSRYVPSGDSHWGAGRTLQSACDAALATALPDLQRITKRWTLASALAGTAALAGAGIAITDAVHDN
jgi:hypothetical protein